jgi:hypothetical protein
LRLNKDAHPSCGAVDPPEIIDGTFDVTRTFNFWYNMYRGCATGSLSTSEIKVLNNGPCDISVNGTIISAGSDYILGSIDHAPDGTIDTPKSQQDYGGGTIVLVEC